MDWKELETETLYIKKGSRYHPVFIKWHNDDLDRLKIGESVLITCTRPGTTAYLYKVTPDTAAWKAAATLAREAMAEALIQASRATPKSRNMYTKEQKELIDKFTQDMSALGGMIPEYWQHKTPMEIADEAIKAVEEFREVADS